MILFPRRVSKVPETEWEPVNIELAAGSDAAL
jgi:hypothetical protein